MLEIKDSKNELKEIVESVDSILITSHISPDDDSIASALGMYSWIKKRYPAKKIDIAYEDFVDSRWQVFNHFDQIQVVDSVPKVFKHDLLILVDANQYGRFTKFEDKLRINNKKLVCIDHHKSKPDKWDLEIIDTSAASAAEIIYQLVYEERDAELAKVLLMGILGDTANLRFVKPSQAHLFDYVKKLVVDAKVDIQSFKASYDYFSNDAIEIAKILISNQQTIQVGKWPTFNITYLEEEKGLRFDKPQIKEGSALYISSFSMLQKEVTWNMTLYPLPEGGVSISFRSLPESINVRKLSEALEIGSGHDRAAGGKWFGEEHTVVDKVSEVLDWLKQHDPILD